MKKENKNEEMRQVFIHKESKHDDALFVSVNGERLLVKKGESVMLPARFAEVIENSENAKRQAEKYICSVSDN